TINLNAGDVSGFSFTVGTTVAPTDITITDDGANSNIVLNTPHDSSAITATGASEADRTATITTATPHGFAVGQVVTIPDVGAAGSNGTFTTTAVPSPTTFQYTAPAGLTSSGGGSVTELGVVPGTKPNDQGDCDPSQGFAIYNPLGTTKIVAAHGS